MSPQETKMLTDLHDVVCGNDEYGHPGIVQKQKAIEKDVKSLKNWRTYQAGFTSAAVAFITYFKFK